MLVPTIDLITVSDIWSTTIQVRLIYHSMYLESLDFKKILDACLTKLENYQILLNKISHRFLLTTKLLRGEIPCLKWLPPAAIRVAAATKQKMASKEVPYIIKGQLSECFWVIPCRFDNQL